MKNTRFKYLRVGTVFVHRNDFYIKTSEGGPTFPWCVNLKTGHATSTLRPYARVLPVSLTLAITGDDDEESIPLPGIWKNDP